MRGIDKKTQGPSTIILQETTTFLLPAMKTSGHFSGKFKLWPQAFRRSHLQQQRLFQIPTLILLRSRQMTYPCTKQILVLFRGKEDPKTNSYLFFSASIVEDFKTPIALVSGESK